MSNCEYKSIIQHIIDNKQFVIKHKPTESNYYESEYYQQQYVYYTFQISFEQNDVLLTLYEYDNDKRVSNIYKYTFDIHKITNDNPCNDAWKWILPFTKRIQYVACGI